MLEVVQWNVENFVNIDKIVKNTEAINKLKKLDIMFIQEWKQEEGLLLLNKLNAEKYHFLYISIESCCIIYNSKKFILEKFVEIKLDFNIERTLIERAYLSIHEHKTSLFASFRPLVKMSIDILHCVCFHLGAFSPEAHKNLHRTQLNQVFKKLLQEIRPKLKNGVIVSGDTNYRTQDNDLLDKLVDKFFSISINIWFIETISKLVFVL